MCLGNLPFAQQVIVSGVGAVLIVMAGWGFATVFDNLENEADNQ